MDKLMSVEEGLMIAPSEDNSWSKTAEWDRCPRAPLFIIASLFFFHICVFRW